MHSSIGQKYKIIWRVRSPVSALLKK